MFGLQDIQPRAQSTITQFDVNLDGTVKGVVQESVLTGQEFYLPRRRIIYVVDNSLNDSPEGFGLLRHVIEPAKRLQDLQGKELLGFKHDLNGVPIVYLPLGEMQKATKNGQLAAEEVEQIQRQLANFIENHEHQTHLSLIHI